MSMSLITAYQGLQSDRVLQIVNLDGTAAANVFTSGSVLSADVWEGQNQQSIFSPSVSWYTAGSTQTGYDQGQVALSIVGISTAMLNPAGEYYLLVSETTSGITAPVWEGRLKIFAVAGSTSPTPPDLITYDFAESYCSILGLTDTQRDQLPYMVAGASMAVRRWCFDRNFDQRTYTEFHDVIQGAVRLLQPPVQIVTRVQGQPQLALTIQNSSAQNAQAYFAFTGTWQGYSTAAQTVTGITLASALNGTPASSTVNFVSNQTVTALATLINAVGGGWTATTNSTYGAWPVTELDGGYIAQGCASGAIPSYGARFNILLDLAPGEFSLDTRRMGLLYVGRQYAGYDAGRWGPGGDDLFSSPGCYSRIKATYTGGETVIPMQIQTMTAELVKFWLMMAKTDWILESETAQEYSYTLCQQMFASMPKHVQQGLSQYRIPRA